MRRRAAAGTGKRGRRSKFTDDEVKVFRKRVESGKVTVSGLAKRLKVSVPTAYKLLEAGGMEGEVKRQRRHSLRDCSQGEEQQKAFEASAFGPTGGARVPRRTPLNPQPGRRSVCERKEAQIVQIDADPAGKRVPASALPSSWRS